MTWTSAFGKGSGWVLQKIVNGLALTKISPNVLTFLGLVINIIAACFFGFARVHNADKMFLIAGLVIIGAGIFDMVDGRVARKTNQVKVRLATRRGAQGPGAAPERAAPPGDRRRRQVVRPGRGLGHEHRSRE